MWSLWNNCSWKSESNNQLDQWRSLKFLEGGAKYYYYCTLLSNKTFFASFLVKINLFLSREGWANAPTLPPEYVYELDNIKSNHCPLCVYIYDLHFFPDHLETRERWWRRKRDSNLGWQWCSLRGNHFYNYSFSIQWNLFLYDHFGTAKWWLH